MAENDYHDEDIPTQPSRPGMGSSDLLRRAFDRAAGAPEPESAPESIGPFRVLGRIGRGGMGSVYKAVDEREGSSGRVVAIKLIRKGMDTEDVLRRFKLEGQLLSALNHPNIAQLHEVAQTDDGQPYFVMEFIEGKPLDVYCDTQRVPIAKRLEIFRKVCAAVHHAHTNLIVHRDLKPGNILVTPDGEPKLLDFGIAKLLNPALGRVEVITRPTMRIMTPEYASPEQVRGDVVGTRSDVYSLGVLLYELLCGRRPYRFAKRIEAEVVRVICESVPMRPSTAITSVQDTKVDEQQPSTTSTTPDSIAQSRSAERVESLRRSLSGDLDDIVMMALSKEPELRYASAQHLSLDLERYLGGHPVEARRTGARRVYLMRKFLRRHRTEVAAAAAVLLAIAIGGTATALQWREASIANARAAESSRAEAAALQESLDAQRDLAIASAFGDALWRRAYTDLTFTLTPGERTDFWERVQESFDSVSERFEADSPQVVRARSLALIEVGNALGGIRSGNQGEFQQAREAYTAARDGFLRVFEASPDDRTAWLRAIESQLRVGDSYRRTNQPTLALAAYKQAVEIADKVDSNPNDLDEQRQRSKPRLALAQAAVHLGDTTLAQTNFDAELASRRERLDSNPDNANLKRDLAVALVSAGELAAEQNKTDLARQRLDEALEIRRALGEQFAESRHRPTMLRDLAVALSSVAIFEAAHGEPNSAREYTDEALAICRLLHEEAPDDARLPWTSAKALVEYGIASVTGARHDQAAWAAQEAAVEIERLENIAPTHPVLATLRSDRRLILGEVALARSEFEEAREHFEVARDQLGALLQIDEKNIGVRRRLGDALVGLAETRRRLKDAGNASVESPAAAFAEARRVYEECGAPGEPFGPALARWQLILDFEASAR